MVGGTVQPDKPGDSGVNGKSDADQSNSDNSSRPGNPDTRIDARAGEQPAAAERTGQLPLIDGIESGADTGANGTTGERPRRKGGWPKGRKRTGQQSTGNAAREEKRQPIHLASGWDKIFFSSHLMLATLLSVPELELTQAESETLADAVKQVTSFYDFEASEKAIAWTNLMTALGTIYGPRIVVIIRRKPAKPATALKPVEMRRGAAAAAGGGPNVYASADIDSFPVE